MGYIYKKGKEKSIIIQAKQEGEQSKALTIKGSSLNVLKVIEIIEKALIKEINK